MIVCVIFIQLKWAFLKYWKRGYFCDIIFIILVSWQTCMVIKGFFFMKVKMHKILYALSFNLLSYLCFSLYTNLSRIYRIMKMTMSILWAFINIPLGRSILFSLFMFRNTNTFSSPCCSNPINKPSSYIDYKAPTSDRLQRRTGLFK